MGRKQSLRECLAKVESLREIINAGRPLTEKEIRLIKAELEILLHDLDIHLKRPKYSV